MTTNRSGHTKILMSLKEKAIERDQTIGYVQGPLPYKQSTTRVSNIVKSILNPASVVTFSYNTRKELIATLDDQSINLTRVLEDKPDFKQIQFSPAELDAYVMYVKNVGTREPNQMDPLWYANKELQQGIDSTTLHLGQKIAINLYTKSSYCEDINPFCRENGRNFAALEEYQLQTRVKDILLITVIATSGLNRISRRNSFYAYPSSFRVDRKLPDAIIKNRVQSCNDTTYIDENGFYSTSDASVTAGYFQLGNTYSLILFNYAGSPVKAYSDFSYEEEILFPPYTKLVVLAHEQVNNVNYFVLKPTEALDIKKETHNDMDSHKLARKNLSLFKFNRTITGIMVISSVIAAGVLLNRSFR